MGPMKRRRFFVPPESIHESQAQLSADESHHLRDVLRCRIGDPVELFDGQGTVYQATVHRLQPLVELDIVGRSATRSESPLQLVLGQSLIKGPKLDLVIQKGTELGMAELVPLQSRHSEIQVEKQFLRQRQERWRKIAMAAAKQCRRANTPLIHAITPLQDFCRSLKDGSGGNPQRFLPHLESFARPDLQLVVSEKGGLPVKSLSGFVAPSRVLILVGPEGGWSDEEIALFQDTGFRQISLGTRILRSETAAMTVAAIAQFLWGDLSA